MYRVLAFLGMLVATPAFGDGLSCVFNGVTLKEGTRGKIAQPARGKVAAAGLRMDQAGEGLTESA